jgi:hypothetical protein
METDPEQEGKFTRRPMGQTHASTEDHDKAGFYQIRIKGHLDTRWAAWFGGVTITLEDKGISLLTSPVADQAALHGLLRKVRDLGLPLLSVILVEPEPGQADGPVVKP